MTTYKINTYIKNNTTQFEDLLDEEINNEIEKPGQIKEQVCKLFKDGDEQAKIIRDKLRHKSKKNIK